MEEGQAGRETQQQKIKGGLTMKEVYDIDALSQVCGYFTDNTELLEDEE